MQKTLLTQNVAHLQELFRSNTFHTFYRVELEEGEYLYRAGDDIPCVYVVAHGLIKVISYAENGEGMIMDTSPAGELVGEAEMILGIKAISDVQAITKATLIGVKTEDCRKAMRENWDLTEWILKTAAGRSVLMSDHYAATVTLDACTRVCRYILAAAQENTFKERLPALSATLRISYRHLLRIMDELTKEGILEKYLTGRRNTYVITDVPRMQKIACGSYVPDRQGKSALLASANRGILKKTK